MFPGTATPKWTPRRCRRTCIVKKQDHTTASLRIRYQSIFQQLSSIWIKNTFHALSKMIGFSLCSGKAFHLIYNHNVWPLLDCQTIRYQTTYTHQKRRTIFQFLSNKNFSILRQEHFSSSNERKNTLADPDRSGRRPNPIKFQWYQCRRRPGQYVHGGA